MSSDALATYGVGEHTITWTAVDDAGNQTTQTQTVVITDTTAPSISGTDAITLEANGAMTAVSLGATASDLVDGSITLTSDGAQAEYAVGEHVITWIAEDAAGNISTQTQTVVIEDTQKPTFEALESLTLIAPVSLDTVTATDVVDGVIEATTDFDASEAGNYTVVWTATDAAGNTQTTEQALTILSLTFDDIASIADITVEAEGELTAVTLPASVSVSSGLLSATPDFVGPFGLGETSVVWSVSVEGGETLAEIQTITVEDTTAPVFDELPSVTLPASGAYTQITEALLDNVEALDAVDGAVSATIVSDTMLMSGAHQVTWQVTDAEGNQATAVQSLAIEPQVNFVTNGFTELGGEATVTVNLSGTAASYPVTVSYEVLEADAREAVQGHTAVSGDVVIESGSLVGVTYQLLDDGVLAEGDEIVLSLVSADNAVIGDKVEHITTAIAVTKHRSVS